MSDGFELRGDLLIETVILVLIFGRFKNLLSSSLLSHKFFDLAPTMNHLDTSLFHLFTKNQSKNLLKPSKISRKIRTFFE